MYSVAAMSGSVEDLSQPYWLLLKARDGCLATKPLTHLLGRVYICDVC